MNGIQIFLRQPLNLGNGHVAYAAQPWALTSINQAQFWKGTLQPTYGNGQVKDCLSM